jgi:hypothetical protein
MSAPVISSVTFDKASYSPGDLITATISYTPGSSGSTQAFDVQATDRTTGQAATLTVSFTVTGAADPTTFTVSDIGNRTWTLKSDTGTVATYTATA